MEGRVRITWDVFVYSVLEIPKRKTCLPFCIVQSARLAMAWAKTCWTQIKNKKKTKPKINLENTTNGCVLYACTIVTRRARLTFTGRRWVTNWCGRACCPMSPLPFVPSLYIPLWEVCAHPPDKTHDGVGGGNDKARAPVHGRPSVARTLHARVRHPLEWGSVPTDDRPPSQLARARNYIISSVQYASSWRARSPLTPARIVTRTAARGNAPVIRLGRPQITTLRDNNSNNK